MVSTQGRHQPAASLRKHWRQVPPGSISMATGCISAAS